MGLQQNNYVCDFYTSFWYKPKTFPFNMLSILPKSIQVKLESEFKKRYHEGLNKITIYQNPWFEFLREISDKLMGQRFSEQMQFQRDRIHDRWVTGFIDKKYSMVIGYEETCLQTFRKAKSKGIITVLDLAQVHYQEIELIAAKYKAFGKIYSNRKLRDKINKIKEEELRLADYIICLSEFAKETLIMRGFSKERIFVANLGFDPLSFSPKTSYSKSGKLKVLFAGTLTGRKGIDLLLKASRDLNEFMELILVGPMADAEELLNQYQGYYTWHPFSDHAGLNKLLSQSDLFAFPSYLDSWAMVVVEAMACGLPVIISENTGAKTAVVDGSGFVIPTGNGEILKDKITYFYKNREALEVMGKNAAIASLNFTWNNYYERINKIAEKLNH